MKSKIGEKTAKSRQKGKKPFFKAYPGAAILIALVLLGGTGFDVSKAVGAVADETVASNTEPARQGEENREDQEGNSSNQSDESEEDPVQDTLVADFSVMGYDDAAQMILPLKASAAPVSLQELKDFVEIQEMVGEVQSGDDGNNTQQTAAVEGATPLVQTGDENKTPSTTETKEDAKTTNVKTSNADTSSLSGKAANHKSTVNSDTIGWLRIPGTNIDYPVVQSSDNSYYVYKDYNKQYSKNGVIYADYECKSGSSLSTNTILYGHNWSNVYSRKVADPTDVMFGQLPSFHTLSFAQQNPFIYFSTTEKDYVWQIFAVFYTEESFNYIEASPSKDYYKTMISEALKRSIHNYNVNVSTSDQILTLSTCTRVYGQRSDQRFVVMAKKVKAGTPSTTITSHPNFKAPQF